jgi:hypothetical protein
LPSRLSWLHLSDLHLTASHARPTQEAPDHTRCLLAVEADIRDFGVGAKLGSEVRPPDFLVISGDIVQAGKDAAMFECAHTWIDRFCAVAGIDTNRVFVVPGNHDIDRSQLPTGHRKLVDLSSAETPDFLRRVDNIWDSPTTLIGLEAMFTNYRAFAQRYASVEFGHLGAWRTQINVDDATIDLIGLNSVWTGGSAALDRPGYPVVGQPQRDMIDGLPSPDREANLTVVLQHNPTSYLNSIDTLLHSHWLDEKDAIVLCGHLHDSVMAERLSMNGRHLEMTGGALYAGHARTRRYSLASMELTSDERRYVVALRAASHESEGAFGEDHHRSGGAHDGYARFDQGRRRPHLGQRAPDRDQLEIDVERAFLRFDGKKYEVRIEKTYSNPTARNWTHVDATVLVNKHPDDPVRSHELYREHPLNLDEIGFYATCNGEPIRHSIEHDHDACKELRLILDTPGIRPQESAAFEYGFVIDAAMWGPYFERHIKRLTRRIECQLEFPATLKPAVTLVRNPGITDIVLDSDLVISRDGDRVIFRWEKDNPRPQSRFRFSWTLDGNAT